MSSQPKFCIICRFGLVPLRWWEFFVFQKSRSCCETCWKCHRHRGVAALFTANAHRIVYNLTNCILLFVSRSTKITYVRIIRSANSYEVHNVHRATVCVCPISVIRCTLERIFLQIHFVWECVLYIRAILHCCSTAWITTNTNWCTWCEFGIWLYIWSRCCHRHIATLMIFDFSSVQL